jgi:predicted glycosyltransferase
LLSCYLEGLLAQPADNSIKTLVICGPEMAVGHAKHIKMLAAKCPNVIFESFTDDMMACLDAADLVISMGGYNTICELLTLGKRAIVIPRINPVQEQWIRAERMAQLGLLRAIHPDKLTSSILMQTIEEELSKSVTHHKFQYQLNLKGLSEVCEAISSLLEQVRHEPFIAYKKTLSVTLQRPHLRSVI